ncbi:MAG: DJ-1/PfpI family protein [Kiritimatiellae bacterium]|jgi:4-methyl-5(b-hydroxyethyl)-thiazole monophosphate biosynthesis|nr:DJ-1/PfpI family protein [Kiritimatiellia bacterium]
MKKACVLLAPGCEEMEAVIVLDVLRRGGIETVSAGLVSGVFAASRDVKLEADVPLDKLAEAKEFDLLVLPGGMPGTKALREDPRVRDLLLHYFQTPGKRVGCICAAALVLDAHGFLEGRRFTCYPGVADQIQGGTYVEEQVVEDGNLITSQGPGTAMAFALKLVELLTDTETRRQVADAMLFAG